MIFISSMIKVDRITYLTDVFYRVYIIFLVTLSGETVL